MIIIQKSHLNETIRKILEKEITKKYIDVFYEKQNKPYLGKEELKDFIEGLFVEVTITPEDKIILKVVAPQLEMPSSIYYPGDEGLREIIRTTLDNVIGSDIIEYEGIIEIQHKN